MTNETTEVATDGNETTDAFDAEFEAAKEASMEAEATDPGGSEPAEPDQPAEKTTEASTDAGKEGGEAAKEADKPPLAYDELNTRWKDAKGMAHAERQKAREAATENQALRSELDELKAMITGGGQQPQQQQGIQFSENGSDPIQDLNALKQLARDMQSQQAEQDRIEQQTAQQRQYEKQIVTGFQAAEAEVIEQIPDYADAVAFLRQSHQAEIEAYNVTGPQLAKEFNNRVLSLAEYAMTQNEMHPGAMMYKLALARGYQPAATSTEAPAPNKAAVAEIEARAKAEPVTQTISGSGGGKSGSDDVDISDVADLEGDEFDRMFNRLRAQEMGAA